MLKKDASIYPKALKCFEQLSKAIALLKGLTDGQSQSQQEDLYRARYIITEAESLFEQTLKNCQRLLGPIPAYASDDFIKWRDEILEDEKIIAKGKNLRSLMKELKEDGLVKRWVAQKEVDTFLESHFDEQQKGKRKLENIKARFIIHMLDKWMDEAKELQKKNIRLKHQ